MQCPFTLDQLQCMRFAGLLEMPKSQWDLYGMGVCDHGTIVRQTEIDGLQCQIVYGTVDGSEPNYGIMLWDEDGDTGFDTEWTVMLTGEVVAI